MIYILPRKVLIFLLSFLCIIAPLSLFSKEDYNKKILRQVDSVFSKLSLREKVAQLFIVDFTSKEGVKKKAIQDRLVKEEKVGGLITMKDNLIPAMQRLNTLNRLASIPMIISIDGEWGVSMRYAEVPSFPRQMQLGALSSDSLVYKMGYAIGQECKELKINVNYAPDIDINNNPNNPVINTRSFGEDKEKVAKFGAAYMRGMRDAGVAGSAKHFPGHGDTDVDSHKALPELPFSLNRLDSLELYPFKHLIKEGVDMVMIGHLHVPVLDPSGRPASISKPIITDFLRNKMGYTGIVCTDALNMDGVAKSCGLEKKHIPLEAYKAGADILLMAQDVENSISEIENAIKNGELSVEELDIKVKKMLTLKASLGLFEKGYSPQVNTYKLADKMQNKERLNLINELARHTITVVTNDGILPIGSVEGKKIAYFGYCGDKYGKEFAQTLMKYAPIDTLILRNEVTISSLEDAKNKLAGYDLIITGFNNTDFRPQKNFGIDSLQMNFLTTWAAAQPMIAVYFGSPYALNKISGYQNFKAFVLGYTNTIANNFAAAQLVFGGIKAIGELPVRTSVFKYGESVILPEQTRLGYYDFEDKGEEYFVEKGLVHGTDSVGKVAVQLNEGANLFTIIPIIAQLIEQAKLKTTGFISDYLHLPHSKHDNILVSDLLNHRSGLPIVDSNFVFTQESVLNLRVQPKLLAEYSEANIYYLHKLADKLGKPFDKNALDMANSLFLAMEMRNTTINKSMKITTTPEDISKFVFTLQNGGKYAGREVFTNKSAQLIEMILPYYLTTTYNKHN